MEMKFDGKFKIDLPREEVFEILSDPEKFAPLLPTFHSMEMKDERTANLKVKVGIGKIVATSTTELTLDEVEPPKRARYVGKGKVMQGVYQMISSFDLEEVDGGTLVKWQGETILVGKILSIAGGGLRGYAEKEINKLITSLQEALSPEAQAAKLRAQAQAKSMGWFARLVRFLFGGGEDKIAKTESASTAVVEPVSYASHPQDSLKLKQESKNKISQLLNTKRTEKRLGRKEDKRLITGQGFFVDDYQPAGSLHMCLVRSPYAHAKILDIDVSKAEALPGVICTITGKEAAEHTQPFTQIGPEPSALIEDYCLAVDKVRYQGDPVVAIIAESKHIAADAAQLVEVDYETLPVVISCEDALKDETVLHESSGTNLTWQGVYEYGEV
ncbi:MAG: SRPBCC family protein, partial [Gammaproteobacteria bacterium]|nr:SRPBCC family protein [Gammaproteobacteria bacterium]